MGLQILNIIQIIHKAGYVYNDMKPDNVTLGAHQPSPKDVRLIDFGAATSYLINGEHIKQAKVDAFVGNIELASFNQMMFNTTSRKDDLESLGFFMQLLF